MTEPKLLWTQEFNQPAGSNPDPIVWGRDVGDGSLYGIPGWGNNELQQYTEGNAQTNGESLEITAVLEEDQWTSARLVTKNKVHFKYGRISIKAKLPAGQGLWPAFWMLGEPTDSQGWPQAGEIDIMEWVGKSPLETLGTLHGPGYSGDSGCGGKQIQEKPVSDDWHEFSITWKPSEITWFIDNQQYFQATPDSVSPHEWVFEHPFYILLNLAVGGNLGGPLAEDLPAINKLQVEYIRVHEFEGFGEVFWINR